VRRRAKGRNAERLARLPTRSRQFAAVSGFGDRAGARGLLSVGYDPILRIATAMLKEAPGNWADSYVTRQRMAFLTGMIDSFYGRRSSIPAPRRRLLKKPAGG